MKQADSIDFSLYRKKLLTWVTKSLIGPGRDVGTESNDHTIKQITPTSIYPTGILFPINQESGVDSGFEEESDEDEYAETTLVSDNKSDVNQAVKNHRYVAPSAAGFSCYVSNDVELYVVPWAVQYINKDKRKHEWKRVPLCKYDEVSETFTAPSSGGVTRRDIWDGLAEIYVLWRQHEIGWIVTVSLCNKQNKIDEGKPQQIRMDFEHKSLFEVELNCEILAGEVYSYPMKSLSLMSEEDQELELQYRHKQIFAIGHGVAIDWITTLDNKVRFININFLPQVEIPSVTPRIDEIDNSVLSLKSLCQWEDNHQTLLQQLNAFVDAYATWQTGQLNIQEKELSADERKVSKRLIERMDIAIKRMRDGIELLKNDSHVQRAFALSNQAMLNQMKQSDLITNQDRAPYLWRPFQLGFILLTLESVVNQDSLYRDDVDLIWFPTGGGKTEAYLGLIAFQILYRRLTNSASYRGTTVIMRYTLRLLTQQQFSRATRLICALELLRQEFSSELREEPITTGMWVGQATSPNQFSNSFGDGALEILEKASDDQAPGKLVVIDCPWCGESLWHTPKNNGYKATTTSFEYHCLNKKCEFSDAVLPINVIDEALYNEPPTLLFATVDKFARLAWDHRAKRFFGGTDRKAPELIIQDELHLISGALGSIVGLYEAALDTVLTMNGSNPKYIASTATIRNAEEQVRALYGKDHKIFPPPGLSADDSFFTRTIPIEQRPGRLYVGYLASLMKKRDAFSALSAALLIAPIAVFGQDKQEREELMDAWWSLLVYHGSLKGVGESQNVLQYQVSEKMEQYLEQMGLDSWYKDITDKNQINDRINALSTAQLTSNKSSEENSQTFSRLEESVEHPNVIDVALATNMISVGLDVGRLALMIINGQPLTTAEYIQSSSRVGRSEVPGIIFANYYRHQARSLSHYENFRPYHDTFYRFVEPTSVTPYTQQARKRALHAALVIVMRHSNNLGLNNNDSAVKFDAENPHIERAINQLKLRCKNALPKRNKAEQGKLLDHHFNTLIAEWKNAVNACKDNNGEIRRILSYEVKGDDKGDRLLYKYQDKIKGVWVTLDSMRNVEDNALMKVTGIYDPPCTNK